MIARMRFHPILWTGFAWCCFASLPGAASAQARFERQHPWSPEQGVWLKIDTHIHSNFSDGAWTVQQLADEAEKNLCDAIAITDHADGNLRGASVEYFTEIRRARLLHPDLIVLSGLEWNIPPHSGDEHVAVILEPTADEAVILAEFKDRFDDLGRESHSPELAVEALAWLTAKCRSTHTAAVIIYNHPGRKRILVDEFRDELFRLRAASELVIGFEGGVGHQAGEPLGAYEGPQQLEERWDPAAAAIGGAWDEMLAEGVDVWAAVSTSDFHHDRRGQVSDYPPGKFSETWVCTPDRTAAGVLQALTAGYFFGSHGQIARQAELTASSAGLPRAAHAGESIRVPPDAEVHVTLRVDVPEWDWQGVINQIDVVELIGVDKDGARVLSSFSEVAAGKELSVDLKAPAGGMVVRARGRREIFQRPDYVFMTNPIRIVTE